MRIIHIQEDLVRSPSEIIIELALCSLHTLETAEAQKMCLTHIGDEAIIRKSDIHKFLYISGMARTHLYHCNLSCRIDLEKSKRNSDTIVEIAFCSSYIVLH